MVSRVFLAGVVASVSLASAIPASADDDALRALGFGLSIINNLQQQQLQQQQQRQQQPQRAQQQRRPTAAAPEPARPRQADPQAVARERQVREVQAALNALGYDAGPVDGEPGPRTRDAVAAFRADYGLDPGSGIDSALAGALRVAARGAPARVAEGASAPRSVRAPEAVTPPLWGEPEIETSPSTLTMQDGTLMIDGRVAAVANSRFDFLSETIDHMALADNLRRMVFQHSMALRPDPFGDDETALAALGMVQPDLAAEILEQGLGRPLSRNEANAVERGLVERDVLGRLDPFEEQDVIAAVRANANRIVPDDLPPSPIRLRVFCSLVIGGYDFETQAFPVSGDAACNGLVRGAEQAELLGPDLVPRALPMSPDAAEAFQSQRHGKTYLAAFDAELDITSGALGGRSAPRLSISARSGLRLLAPGSLTRVIHDFGGGAAEPAEGGGPVMVDGDIYVDGRMAAASTTNLTHAGGTLDPYALARSMERLTFTYGLALRPDEALRTDEEALAALRFLPAAARAEVVEEALARPLTDEEIVYLEGGEAPRLLHSVFQQRKAAKAVRARGDTLVPPDLAEPPLPLRVFCGVRLGPYDFETESFPVAWQDCDQGLAGAAGKVQVAGDGPVPERIEMAPDAAEALASVGGYDLRFLASFDADLGFSVRRTEAGAQVTASLANRAGLRLHPPYDPAEVVWHAPEAGAATAVSAAPPTGSGPAWVLWDEADRAEMAALAGEPKTFPANGAVLLAAAQGALGSIEGPARMSVNEAGTYWPAALFDTYHATERGQLAAALSVPVDYVVELQGPSSGQGLGGVYGLLPAPAASYRATPPDDLYGESDLRYQWKAAVTAVHAFALPGGGGILLAVLQPIEGRFETSTGGDPQVLERFDLTARVPPPEVALIEPESRAAIALAAAGAADPVELLTGLLDKRTSVFERSDLARALVAEREGEAPVTAFWTEGELTFGEYDLKAGAFPVVAANLGPVELLRTRDLPPHAIMLHLASKGLAIPMDVENARAWAEAHPGNRHRVRARFGIERAEASQAGSVFVQGDLLEVELLSPEAVVTRRDPADVLWRHEVAPAAAAAAVERKRWDILGLTIGSPLDAAVEQARAEIAADVEFAMDRSSERPFADGAPFATGRLLHSAGSTISIGLFSHPGEAGETVTAILRAQSFPEGSRPMPDAVRGLLLDRYGEPAAFTRYSGLHVFTWAGAASDAADNAIRACVESQRGQAGRAAGASVAQPYQLSKPDGSGRIDGATAKRWVSPWIDAETRQPWASAEAWLLDPASIYHDRRPELACNLGEVLVAVIALDEAGKVRSLQVLLSDPVAAASLAGTGAPASVGAPEAAVPEIKL